MFGVDTNQLREDLRAGTNDDVRRRRIIAGVSLIGLASMAAISLLQTGIIKRLPELPIAGFDVDKVTLSDEAYQMGVPDAPVAAASLAANLPLAAFGEAKRAQTKPLVPLLAAAKASIDTLVGGWYLYNMLFKIKTWCSYCMVGSLASAAVLTLSIPEAMKAFSSLRGRQ